MNILIFIIILLVLVIAHEWGHFFTAKKFGIRVDEFGFGFPPRALILFKKGETTYTLNWLPIGGFVKIFGEDPNNENTNGPDANRSFVNKPKWQQAIVLSAGVLMNFIIGWALVVGLYAFGTSIIFDDTLPAQYMNNTHLVIAGVSKGTPADIANIQAGDIISKVSYADKSKTLDSYIIGSFVNFVRNSNGALLEFDIIRDQVPMTINVTPIRKTEHFMIGIAPALEGYIKLSFFDSITQGFHSSFFLVKETARGIVSLISGKESLDNVSGPVGMVSMIGEAVKRGPQYVILFTALISMNLAVINLIPFPALDGGRLLFLLIEKIKGSRINAKFANTANMIGFAILILFMIVVTFKDIVKLF